MKIQRILVTVDFSKYDHPALATATSLARDNQAQLFIVHVRESLMAYGGKVYQGQLNPSPERLQEMLMAIVPDGGDVKFENHLIHGEGTASLRDTDIARAIARFADQQDVDLIVTSTHGRSGLRRVLVGSVAERIISQSTCPVLTVKLPQEPM